MLRFLRTTVTRTMLPLEFARNRPNRRVRIRSDAAVAVRIAAFHRIRLALRQRTNFADVYVYPADRTRQTRLAPAEVPRAAGPATRQH